MSLPVTPPASADRLGAAAAIRLVAGREISSRLASKGFRYATLAFVVGIILAGILIQAATDDDSARKVGIVPGASAATAQIEAAATGQGTAIEVVPVPDQAAGESQVSSGDLDALITSVTPTLDLVVKESLDPGLASLFGGLSQQLALVGAVEDLGGDPVAVTQQISAAAPNVTSLEPPPEIDAGQVVAGYVTGILLFLAIMTAGQLVAQGVVEEKSSRVVELLLSTIRPWQLVTGKVLGIGVIGLLQTGAVVAAGVGTAFATGLMERTQVDLGATALWALVWFVIGFTTYALLLAGLASLVSRQEEVASVISPVTTLMIVPYVIGVSIAPWDPNNPLVVWLSRLPFTAPLVMPIRIALGQAEAWEIALAVGLSLLVLPLLVWFAGRVYSNAVLRSGGRVRLRDALKEA